MKNQNDFQSFLTDHVNLSQSKIDLLDQKIISITGLLSEKLSGYQKFEKQGSYALKTMISPVKDDDEVDADLLIYMKDQPGWTPRDYLGAVWQVFHSNGNYKDIVRRKTRCVTIDYRGDFHVDLVPAIERADGVYICNRDEEQFEKTDGTGLRDWFNDKNRETGGQLKRVVRLIKFLRDHKDNFTVKSILLTTLLGMFVRATEEFSDTATALKSLVERLDAFLQANSRMPRIANPVLPGEDFNRHWDQTKYDNFSQKIRIYSERIADAYIETDRNTSIRKWRKLFGDGFGTITESTANSGASFVPSKPYAK